MLCGLPAAGAHVGDMLLFKGYAPALHASGLLLELILAGAVPAPHGLDEAGLILGDIKKLLMVMGGEGL